MSRFGGDPWAAFPDADAAVATATPSKDPWASFPDAGGEVHDDGVTNARDRAAIDVLNGHVDYSPAPPTKGIFAGLSVTPDPHAPWRLPGEAPVAAGIAPAGYIDPNAPDRSPVTELGAALYRGAAKTAGDIGSLPARLFAGPQAAAEVRDALGGAAERQAPPSVNRPDASTATKVGRFAANVTGESLPGLAEIMPSPGLGTGASILNALPRIVGFSAAHSSEKFDDAIRSGASPEDAITRASVSGAVETAFNTAGLLPILNQVPGVRGAVERLALPRAAAYMAEKGANATAAGLQSVAQGAFNEWWENVPPEQRTSFMEKFGAGAIPATAMGFAHDAASKTSARGEPSSTLTPESAIRPAQIEPDATSPEAAKASPDVPPRTETPYERPIAEEVAPSSVEERPAETAELPKLPVAEAADRPAQERDVQRGVLEPAPVQEVGDGAEQLEGPTRRAADGPADVQDRVTPAPAEETAPVAKATDVPPRGFTTEKGSVYTIDAEGRTTRDKAARAEHPGDSGLKPISDKTVYVAPDAAHEVGMFQSLAAENKRIAVGGDGKLILLYKNAATGKLGRMATPVDMKFSETPAVGLHPVELWEPDASGFFKGNHPGSKIISIDGAVPPAAAPPSSRLDRLIDATNRWEQAIVDRSKNRAIPRGRNVGATILIPELSDLAVRAALRSVRVAAKGAKVGARTIHAVRDEVVSMAKELGVNMGEHTAAVVRAAHRIVVRVGDDPERIDAEIAAHYARHKDEAPKRSVKQTIRESVEGPKAAKTITEPQALKAKLKAEEKGANVGFRAGKAEAMETMQARIDKLRSDIRSKANTIEQVREKVIGAIKDLVPNERQHAFITAASDAKSVVDYWRVLARAQREAFDHSARVAGREAVKAVDDAISTKMLTSDNAKAKDLETRLKVAKARLREQASPSVKLRVTQQLNDIHNEARELVARHKNAQTIMVGERIVKTENLVKSFTDDVAKGAKIKRASQGVETAPEPGLLGKADRYLMSQDTLGKVVGNEDVHRLMTDDLWDGQREVARDLQGGQDAIEKWLGEAGVKPGSEEAQKLSADVVGAKKARKTTVKLTGGETIDMTPAEHMSLVATLTDSNAGPQIAGGLADVTFLRDPLGRRTKLDEGDAERIIKALPENLRGVVDKAKAYVEKESRPKLFEAFRKEKGYDLDAVEGYWRTRRNWESSDASPEVVKKYRDAALTNLGFEKPREGGKLPYLIGDFFTDFHDIIHQSSAVANMASRVSQLQMIFTDPRVKAAIGERFGHGMNRNIQKFVEEGKLLFRQPQDVGGKVTDFITKGLSRAVLPLNPSPMLKNIAGVFKLGNEISPDRIAKAAKIAYSDEVTKIIQEDPYFRDRYEGGSGKRLTPVFSERPATVGESSVLDLVKRGAVGQIVDRIPIFDFFDQIPVRLAIADRVLAARESGASGDTAGRESSHLVERTQNSSNPLNMSPLQLEARGTFWRTAATMFKSDAYKSYGMLRAASGQGRGPFLRALAAVGLSNAWAAAVTALFAREAWKKIAGKEEDQKKDRDLSTTFATAFTRNAAEMLPLGGDAFDMISAGTVNRPKQGLPNFAKILQGPLSQTASTMGEALAQAYQAIGSGDELFKSGPHKGEEKRGVYAKQSVENALRAAGRVLGVPLEPLWNLAKKADSVAGDE